MALKKPLVITGGQIQELGSGDTLDAQVTEVNIVQLQNNNASPITIGEVVYADGAGTVDLAQANAAGTEKAIGFVADASIAAAATGGIITSGVLSGLTGLTAGSKYYLDAATPGAYTTTAPSTGTQYVRPIGIALSTTEMKVDIDVSVLLA